MSETCSSTLTSINEITKELVPDPAGSERTRRDERRFAFAAMLTETALPTRSAAVHRVRLRSQHVSGSSIVYLASFALGRGGTGPKRRPLLTQS